MAPTKLAGAFAAAALTAALAIPGVANASTHAGERDFQQVYPVASKLCTEVAHGGGPARLHAVAPQVLADCTVLESGFNTARAAVLSVVSSIRTVHVSDLAVRRAACNSKPPHPERCLRARRVLQRLELQRMHSVRAYYRLLEANRVVFWNEIRGLPGGKDVKEDTPVPQLSS